MINYRNCENNPDEISFRSAGSDQNIKYTPITIRAFTVYNEIYLSGIVQSETSPNQTIDLNSDKEVKIRMDTTFLRAMFQGTKNLYCYIDKHGKENFYINQYPDFELLVYKKYLKSDKNFKTEANVIAENKKFAGQLLLYLQDCPGIQPKINAAVYTKKSLEAVFKAYYECSKGKTTYKYTKEKTGFDFGALAGFTLTDLNLKTSSNEDWHTIANMNYKVSAKASAGLYMDFILPRNKRKWSIYNELLYTSYEGVSHFEELFGTDHYKIYDTKIGGSYLKLNNMIRYTYPVNPDFSVFMSAGISNGFDIWERNSQYIEEKFYSTHTFSKKKALDETRLFEQGIIVGIGSKYRSFSFEASFEKGNGMSVYTALKTLTNNFSFLFGYKF